VTAVPDLTLDTKLELLRGLTVGSRVAEDEAEELGRYFVETDQWRRILAGQVDVIFGQKGAGKSAIYTSLVARRDELVERDILVIPGENPRGAAAFADLVSEPPTSEREFIAIWKFYVLSLLATVLEEEALDTEAAERVIATLRDAGLAPEGLQLNGVVRRVRDYVWRLLNAQSVEPTMGIDPATGLPNSFSTKITLGEPNASERAAGFISVDELIRTTAGEFSKVGRTVWVVFDRLDVAFADNVELEANALRALFKVYLDLLAIEAIRLKIFLRTDIWQAITRQGFREASHVTRVVTIEWTNSSLLNVIVHRLLQNEPLVGWYQVDRDAVLRDAGAQRGFFDRLVPDKIDSGQNPKTFEWMIGRVKDGAKVAAPRELIHLLSQARDMQVQALERGESQPENGMLFTRQAFRDALPEVSRVRLVQTLYAEYPNLRQPLEALNREKTAHSPATLAPIWGCNEAKARQLAEELVDIGFFERRGSKQDPVYWVPFLYRPALELVQGSAFAGGSDEDEADPLA
jgi:hypothetical protein